MMSKYSELFPKTAFFPVIHVVGQNQALKETEVAMNAGADGVFIISHTRATDPSYLVTIYESIKDEFPDVWMGINLLGVPITDLFGYGIEITDAVWTDNAQVSPDPNVENPKAEAFLQQAKNWAGLNFGGVAFKYQKNFNDDPAKAALAAVPFVDVITTTGVGTGSAPTTDKLIKMREAVLDHPIAIASGISAKNVEPFLRIVNCFLVSSSITNYSDQLDPNKTKELARIIHQTA